MRQEQKHSAYFLGKAEEYRKKADAATSPLMKATFEAIVQEYMRRARELDPALAQNGPS